MTNPDPQKTRPFSLKDPEMEGDFIPDWQSF